MIKKIDEDIIFFQQKIDVLQERKAIIQKMSAFVETLKTDEKQALYELLHEQSLEGDLGWSK